MIIASEHLLDRLVSVHRVIDTAEADDDDDKMPPLPPWFMSGYLVALDLVGGEFLIEVVASCADGPVTSSLIGGNWDVDTILFDHPDGVAAIASVYAKNHGVR